MLAAAAAAVAAAAAAAATTTAVVAVTWRRWRYGGTSHTPYNDGTMGLKMGSLQLFILNGH